MATLRRNLSVSSLTGLLLAAPLGCGTDAGGDAMPPASEVPPAVPLAPPSAGRPVPISGGTLLILRDGVTAVAADADRDVIWVADVDRMKQTGRINLPSGDEPGRLVEDAAGRVHVALRRGGALLTIDPATGTAISRRAACPAPRGVAYDPASDHVQLVCAGGELVTFAAGGGPALRTVQLDSDLRDVVVQGDHLLVSRFRSAEVLTVDAAGAVVGRVKPKPISSTVLGVPTSFLPAVAWQLRPLSADKAVMLFERGSTVALNTARSGSYYDTGDQCADGGIVAGSLTVLGPMGEDQPGPLLGSVAYAVDFAVSPNGSEVALVSPDARQSGLGFLNVMTVSAADLSPADPCKTKPSNAQGVLADDEVIAIAYDGAGRIVTQSRNPALLRVDLNELPLKDAVPVDNEGHHLFHAPTHFAIACASCHPEAGDDGRTWNFTPIGPRRTQSLRGGLLATAPFHWDGTMDNMGTLLNTVFVNRMGGVLVSDDQIAAVANWLDAQPALPKAPPADPAAVARGKTLFESAQVGCASCHSGAHFTNNATVAVGTGGSFQVPSLIDVQMRPPYMHSGCATTLDDRFDPACGGGDSHGKTSQLSPDQVADLSSYLRSL